MFRFFAFRQTRTRRFFVSSKPEPKGLWSDFKTEFFLIKIQIENYLKPPFLIVSAGKWVRVDNIRSTWSVLWCFGHSQGALEHFGSFLHVELFWGEMVHTEPNWCPKMGPEWAKMPCVGVFYPCEMFWVDSEHLGASFEVLGNFIQ